MVKISIKKKPKNPIIKEDLALFGRKLSSKICLPYCYRGKFLGEESGV